MNTNTAETQSAISSDIITITPVNSKAERRQFARMTIDLYKDDPAFVQPLDFELLARLNPEANPLLKNNDHQLWLSLIHI